MSISGGRIRTTPGWQIWTKQAAGRENVASFTNMGYRKLKVQVAPSSSQPIALLQINSPTCSGSRMSSTTTKPCSPWVNCCGAWPAKDCRIYERIQIHNTQVAFHADMSIHSSEMWPVLVPSSGEKKRIKQVSFWMSWSTIFVCFFHPVSHYEWLILQTSS